MNNLFDQIEQYIDGGLVGEELIQFEQALETNESLQKEVEVYRAMIEGVRMRQENHLRRKFTVMDAALDKQLEEEDNISKPVKEEPKPAMGKVIAMPVYKTSWFRVAAAILVVVAAYLITPPNTQVGSNELALEQYEVEYKGWKVNSLQYSATSKEHASDDDIEGKEGASNTAQSIANEIEGTTSIEQYKQANDYFKKGKYYETIAVLQQIKDINLQRKNFRLGMVYYANQDLTKAIVRLKKTVEASDNQISTADLNTAKWNLAMAYTKQEKMEEALPYFNELAKSDNAYSQKAGELVQKMK